MDPATTQPAQPPTTGDTAHDGFISHNRMREHHQQGLATPLSRIITDFVNYDNRWWIADNHGWHLIDDQHLITKLDNHHNWAEGGLYLGGR